jgi:HD-GYP domain-containing protein (c-di-GMP phosphodiesterase class II)
VIQISDKKVGSMPLLKIFLMQESECLDVALHARDAYTGDHCHRVQALCMELGRRCALDKTELNLLRIASKLHDIGKIGIPDHILLKPARFEPDEWEIMKTHAALGEEICSVIPHEHAAAVASIIRHHHEYFDGKGYPDGLAGEDIPIAARIISIIDGYDAMTTTRPYHEPRTHDTAMSILDNEKGARIDAHVFGQFKKIIAKSEYRAL